MASQVAQSSLPAEPATTELRLSSGNGPITRTILKTPLRDATPAEIPIIDISGIFSSSLSDRQDVAGQIRAAATNMGFFYISHHRIPTDTIENAYKACLEFFHQDKDVKLRSDISRSTFYNGYRAPKSLSLNPNEGIDVREAFSVTYDPRYDPTIQDVDQIPEAAKKHLRCEDVHWDATANLPRFKDALVRYFQGCLSLARALTRSFALSLDLDEDYFDTKVQYPDTAFSFNYYPPLPASSITPAAGDNVSIGSHTDFQLFTILWQDSIGGLQVLNRSGQWLRAAPKEGTMVVNIGDYMQRLTSNRYISTVHRAQNWSGKERVSMPFFWGFGLHESCGVLGGDGEEIKCEEWVRKRAKGMEVEKTEQ